MNRQQRLECGTRDACFTEHFLLDSDDSPLVTRHLLPAIHHGAFCDDLEHSSESLFGFAPLLRHGKPCAQEPPTTSIHIAPRGFPNE